MNVLYTRVTSEMLHTMYNEVNWIVLGTSIVDAGSITKYVGFILVPFGVHTGKISFYKTTRALGAGNFEVSYSIGSIGEFVPVSILER